jgi:hypothetical protein
MRDNETRIAMQLAGMLPDDKDQALKILAIMRELVDRYFGDEEKARDTERRAPIISTTTAKFDPPLAEGKIDDWKTL